MRDDILVSVIVPVFKAEPFIEKCVRNLMEQSMKDGIEFIFINDCTPDNSMEILSQVIENYTEREKQIRIVHHEDNKGITYTRKEGIMLAHGEYIAWCDSDDWVEDNYYQTLFNATENGQIDIVFCDFIKEFIDRTEFIEYPHYTSPKQYLHNFDSPKVYCPFLWAHLIRVSLYREWMDMVVPVSFAEDNYLLIYIYNVAESIVHIKTKQYHYNLYNFGSLCHKECDSAEEWRSQRENLFRVETVLNKNFGADKCKRAINCLKFFMKNRYRKAFASKRDYFEEYRNSHWYILGLYHFPVVIRLKLFFIYSSFPLYDLFTNKKQS